MTFSEAKAKNRQLKQYFNDAERIHHLPKGLLWRVAYQESRFRSDIITGKVISSANAVGIMQIVPKWHPNVDPLNVVESIYYAAAFLERSFKRFQNWPETLAAYNWGPGNVAKKGLENAPDETRNYIDDVLGDIWQY